MLAPPTAKPGRSEVDPITGKRIVKINETMAQIEPIQKEDGFLYTQYEPTGRMLWFEDGSACWEGLGRYKSVRRYYRPKSRELRDVKVPQEMRVE